MATPARDLLSSSPLPGSRDLAWRAVESMPAGTLVYSAEGQVLYANPMARKILEISTEMVSEVMVADIFGSAPHAGLDGTGEPEAVERGKISTGGGKGEGRRTLGYKVARIENELAGSALPESATAHQDAMYVLIFQDITQLEQLRAERDRFQHLASMARLFPTIAHEIKNPLAAIQGVVEILLESYDDSEQQVPPGLDGRSDETGAGPTPAHPWTVNPRDDLEIVLEEVARLRLLVDRMGVSDQSLQSRGEAIDLVPIVQMAFRLAARRASVLGLTLVYKGPEAMLMALRKDLFLMILHNLINNAVEASKRGDSITVCLESAADVLTLQVLDSGSGMSAEAIERATEPFFSTRAGSTGIGLALIDQLIKRSNGSLSIWSSLGEGTEVEVRVPECRQ